MTYRILFPVSLGHCVFEDELDKTRPNPAPPNPRLRSPPSSTGGLGVSLNSGVQPFNNLRSPAKLRKLYPSCDQVFRGRKINAASARLPPSHGPSCELQSPRDQLVSIHMIPFKVGSVYLNHRPRQWPDGPAGVARVGSTPRHPLVLFTL